MMIAEKTKRNLRMNKMDVLKLIASLNCGKAMLMQSNFFLSLITSTKVQQEQNNHNGTNPLSSNIYFKKIASLGHGSLF